MTGSVLVMRSTMNQAASTWTEKEREKDRVKEEEEERERVTMSLLAWEARIM
jgi:hypothetical protein